MRDRDDDPIELHQSDEGKYSFEHSKQPKSMFGPRMVMWATLIGGIAIGTILFLSFLTLFVYLFLPILVIMLLWSFFKMLRSKRM